MISIGGIWSRAAHLSRWFVALPPLLIVTSARAQTPEVDRPAVPPPAPTAPGNAKYQATLDEQTKWQPYGGSVRFTVTGLDVQHNIPLVTACLRWKVKDGAVQPCLDATPVRIGETRDKSGIIYAASVPLAWRDRAANVEELFLGIPLAELQVSFPEQPTAQPSSLQIGITVKAFAGLVAAVFALMAGLVLRAFARALGAPGSGPVLPLISSANGWASLGQFQIVLWTILVGAGAIYVMTLTGSLIEISKGTLILLGIAGGAAVGSQIKTNQQGQTPPTLAPPAAVTGLSDISDSYSVMLSWLVPTPGNTPPVFSVEYRESGTAGPWSVAANAVRMPRFRLFGLKPQTDYEFQVFATNGAGRSPPSSPTVRLKTPASPAHACGSSAHDFQSRCSFGAERRYHSALLDPNAGGELHSGIPTARQRSALAILHSGRQFFNSDSDKTQGQYRLRLPHPGEKRARCRPLFDHIAISQRSARSSLVRPGDPNHPRPRGRCLARPDADLHSDIGPLRSVEDRRQRHDTRDT